MHLTGAVDFGGHRWRLPSTCSDKNFKGHPNMTRLSMVYLWRLTIYLTNTVNILNA